MTTARAPLPEAMGWGRRVTVAPMAGGATTPGLVAAAERHGAFAQLAAGYLDAATLRDRIRRTRALGASRFGVNLFAPHPHAIAPDRYAAYWSEIAGDARRVLPDATMPPLMEDDDDWHAKVDVVLAERVPVVSITFGLPDPASLARLRDAGVVTVQTVTTAAEAAAAARAGVDALVVQAAAAGGHSGVWAPDVVPADVPLPQLVGEVRAATTLPIVAAGGIASRGDARAALEAGADAVAVGTAALRADEVGTSATYRAALAGDGVDRTALTRAFTGRYARALVTPFVTAHADAPSGYPALHHLTRPMRAAAATAGDASLLHLWAGTGWRSAREAPIATILDDLEP
ncbi:nitronate monooxygenase [Agrococcus sp. SGAir0287]|uniref:nitronate monooxygenase n=1 Tax=Agrococcus sp. SGAir0287 TaxID=2070347 RepID=UPI0020C75632|nr:nitronate monooxygenase [Agrococcus sp. SGAir0287]